MEEYYIRILLISEIEKNYTLSYDLETTKKITLQNTKNNIIKYIIKKHIIGNAIVKPNTIEDYLMDELNGNITNTNFDAENIYLYIFPYILEFIDNYIDKII